jgi:hypothetical protein
VFLLGVANPSNPMELAPSKPKETDIRQGIPAKGHGHWPVAVAEEARRCEDVKPGADE